MQKRIWLDYNRNLVQRGSLCFLIDPKLGESIKTYKKVSSGGRPTEYNDAFIQVLAASPPLHLRFRFGSASLLLKKKNKSIRSFKIYLHKNLYTPRKTSLQGLFDYIQSVFPYGFCSFIPPLNLAISSIALSLSLPSTLYRPFLGGGLSPLFLISVS